MLIHAHPNLLIDESAPTQARTLYMAATRDQSTQIAAQRVADALHQLVDQVAISNSIRAAVLLALRGSGNIETVRKNLRGAELEVLELLAAAKEQNSLLKAKLDARLLEIQPVLVRVTREVMDLPEKVKAIEARIAGFDLAQAANRERLKDAGYSNAEIEDFDVRPTASDLAAWRDELALLPKREAQLNAFLASSPLYDEALLADATTTSAEA